MMTTAHLLVYALFILGFAGADHNKYSKDANTKNQDQEFDFRPSSLHHLDRPFRMAKLNLLWTKAVVRLTEPKLKSLFGELKLHDKEELAWKHLRGEGKDKDGLKEAELRDKLKTIMKNYELFNTIEEEEEIHDARKAAPHRSMNEATSDKQVKAMFKDKKLNKLWQKAELAGFTHEELGALKEEFTHHQDKVDQYYQLLNDVRINDEVSHDENSVDDTLDKFNTIEHREEGAPPAKDYAGKANQLRETNRAIKDSLDHLSILASRGPASREFVEPRVNGLWKIALENNFTASELESLKVELRHYENRLLKLRHIQAEHALHEEKYKNKGLAGEKEEVDALVKETIKKQAKKVDKIHLDLETRIMQKHIEL